jgi:two-component system chemotaxis response regulator CheY
MNDILIVDDMIEMRRFLASLLVRAGFNVRAVGSGKEALQCYRTKKPALVVLDACMPDMDGVETLQALRALDQQVRVIGVSGLGPGAATLFLKMMSMVGAFAILEKPFTPEVFLKTVRKVLNCTGETKPPSLRLEPASVAMN